MLWWLNVISFCSLSENKKDLLITIFKTTINRGFAYMANPRERIGVKILKMNNLNDNIIFSYNLMLYDLFVNGYSSHHQIQGFLNALINDDLFDYESAIVLAIFFDDYEFVEKHLDYFNKTFLYEDNIKKIINNYLSLQIKPKTNEIANILEPKTYYENNFYLTK